DPFIKAELDKTLEKTTYLKEEYVQTRLNLQRLINEIKTVGEQNVDKEKKDMLKKLTDKYQKISLEVKELNTQLQKLQLKLRENKKGFIFAREKMFTNIEIGIRNLSYKVREETDFCTFYDENGEIKWKQFDEIILNKYAGALMATAEKEEKTKNK
ncbi:MAG TPA: FapA family protein, partial [bacterium]|nr:FapA family protein [bacterium]